jgi:site-specific DNA recombinase
MQITRIPAQRENKKTRIAVYCRVSTKMEEQEDSLETQQAAYTNLISMRSDWELVGIYSDSLSGLSAEKRPEFMRMISDAMEGKIDRILCKSVSRFSRNVAECKKYTDLLRLKNVIVEFEKEHISTEDTTSAFLFSLMSAIAENENVYVISAADRPVDWLNDYYADKGYRGTFAATDEIGEYFIVYRFDKTAR